MNSKKSKVLIILLVVFCLVFSGVQVCATETIKDNVILDDNNSGDNNNNNENEGDSSDGDDTTGDDVIGGDDVTGGDDITGGDGTTDGDNTEGGDNGGNDSDFTPEDHNPSTNPQKPNQNENVQKPKPNQGSTQQKPQQNQTVTSQRPQQNQNATQQRPQQNQNVVQQRPQQNQNVVTQKPVTQTTDAITSETETQLNIPEGMYVIWFEFNDGSPRRPSNPASEPELITEPSEPSREGFIFCGWYKDAEFVEPWNFYVDYADEGTVLYAKWEPDPKTVVFNVTVIQTSGGRIEVNPSVATPGYPVRINVFPDDGMRLKSGSVTVNGEHRDVLSFIMPSGDVVVSAEFEVMPEKEITEENPSVVPYIIGIIAVIVVVTIIAVIVIKTRKDDFAEDEIDENGTVIEDDDRSWVDESIVVGDGFKNGEKIVGDYVPEDEMAMFFEDEQ